MPQARFLALFTLLVAFGAGAARADEKPGRAPQITLKDLYGGGRRFTKPIPRWSWRPGHVQLVRTHARRAADRGTNAQGRAFRRVLEVMDPATGKTEELLDFASLRSLVPGKGTVMRGVGRAGAPAFKWRGDGKSLCAVVKGDLVWVDLASGTRRRLTETDAPMRDLTIAPDGSYVSFSKDRELWVCATAKGTPYPLTTGSSETLLNGTLDWVYPEELGHRTAAWFSPDSKRIAYLQMDQSKVPRYRVPGILPLRSQGREMFYPKAGDPNPKVRVGVLPVRGGGKPAWLQLERAFDTEPHVEYVVRVTWTPDARRVLVVTLDRLQQHMRIHACDPVTGAGRVVWEKKTRGWFTPPTQPKWVNEHVFLWALDEGLRRWYYGAWDDTKEVVSMGPASPPGLHTTAVLRGEHDPGGKRAIFQGIEPGESTQGIFLADPSGGRLEQFRTRALFAQDAKFWTSARLDETVTYALVTTANAVTPPRTVLVTVADGKVVREIGNAHTKKLDALRLAVPEFGVIDVPGMRDGIRWQLWKPHDFDPKKRYGLVVHTYGGPGSRMVSNNWGRGPLLQTLLCDKGFLVLKADGFGTGGQGPEWLFSVRGKLGIRELEGQVDAVREILKRGYVDPERVGIWGWSYGGTMACNALTMRSDVFKAGVAVASVTDWRLYDTIYTERYMGLPKDNARGYKESSSITHAKKMTGKLLMMHGMSDDNVHVQNTLRLQEAFLKAKNLNYEMMLYPKRGHGIGGASLDVFTRLVGWFEEHIGAP